NLVIYRADLNERGQQRVATEFFVHVRDIRERAHRGERRCPGVANLDNVRGVGGVGQSSGELLERIAPCHGLDGQGAARIGFVLGDEVVNESRGGVRGAHEPQRDVLSLDGTRGRTRRVLRLTGRGASGKEQGSSGRRGEHRKRRLPHSVSFT